jgi:hypothetical protein
MRRLWWLLLLMPVALFTALGSNRLYSDIDEGERMRSLLRDTPLVASRIEEDRGQWIYTGPGKATALRAELIKSIGSRPGWRSTGAGWTYGEVDLRHWWHRIPGMGKLFPNRRPYIRVLVLAGKASNTGLPPSLPEEWRTVFVYEHQPSVRGFPNGDFMKKWAVSH